MRGLRLMLLGLSITLTSGFLVVHDLLWIRYESGYGPLTDIFVAGLWVGFVVSTIGLVYGVATDSTAGTARATSGDEPPVN